MATTVTDTVISAEALSVQRGTNALLRNVDWQVNSDQRWVVLGPNGAGKTTLLNLAAALMHPTKGTMTVLGEKLGRTDVFELRPRIGLTSDQQSDRIPADETAVNVVQTAAWSVVGRWREEYDEVDTDRAMQLLDWLGIAHLSERTFGTLSEGERKRVHIARAIMNDPELLLFDEPMAGLDLGAREGMVAALAALAKDANSPAMVVVTHHVEEIPPGFTHALLLSGGQVVTSGPIEEALTSQTLSTTFGLSLGLTRFNERYTAQAALSETTSALLGDA
ncbi:ABC transporter ATP-binding protein [Natronoglycomyces albus]|uniref:ABC transporter ATP-binding protein n=1 Tax=Natronoglycomyces albus TaxID=2811108 RepID=A0A895XPS4_9ACTN|nr:ABC transporter ATP-binding protein [Natronoglycomyces albus]QSB04280.1 ABC transporter ATP-binding protein [Natronoglycomyces albus]